MNWNTDKAPTDGTPIMAEFTFSGIHVAYYGPRVIRGANSIDALYQWRSYSSPETFVGTQITRWLPVLAEKVEDQGALMRAAKNAGILPACRECLRQMGHDDLASASLPMGSDTLNRICLTCGWYDRATKEDWGVCELQTAEPVITNDQCDCDNWIDAKDKKAVALAHKNPPKPLLIHTCETCVHYIPNHDGGYGVCHLEDPDIKEPSSTDTCEHWAPSTASALRKIADNLGVQVRDLRLDSQKPAESVTVAHTCDACEHYRHSPSASPDYPWGTCQQGASEGEVRDDTTGAGSTCKHWVSQKTKAEETPEEWLQRMAVTPGVTFIDLRPKVPENPAESLTVAHICKTCGYYSPDTENGKSIPFGTCHSKQPWKHTGEDGACEQWVNPLSGGPHKICDCCWGYTIKEGDPDHCQWEKLGTPHVVCEHPDLFGDSKKSVHTCLACKHYTSNRGHKDSWGICLRLHPEEKTTAEDSDCEHWAGVEATPNETCGTCGYIRRTTPGHGMCGTGPHRYVSEEDAGCTSWVKDKTHDHICLTCGHYASYKDGLGLCEAPQQEDFKTSRFDKSTCEYWIACKDSPHTCTSCMYRSHHNGLPSCSMDEFLPTTESCSSWQARRVGHAMTTPPSTMRVSAAERKLLEAIREYANTIKAQAQGGRGKH